MCVVGHATSVLAFCLEALSGMYLDLKDSKESKVDFLA